MKIFLAGWVVLVGAILINMIAKFIGIPTWYDFLEKVRELGFLLAFKNAGIISLIFLFGIYPTLLGALAFVILELF